MTESLVYSSAKEDWGINAEGGGEGEELLVIGYWLLDVGCWLLDVEC